MPKKNLTSLELATIINELQFLVGGKVSQIYHQEKTELLFQLHARGEGKKLLKIVPGKFFCLTAKKDPAVKPSSFCMQLRKHLSNASINAIYQKGSERIVIFELEKEQKFNLIIELFSRGNLVLIDSNHKIIAALEQKNWKDRKVRVKEQYVFLEPGTDWKKITEKELSSILKKSEKKNLATSLATEVGLGGIYAEEVCKLTDVDKNILPNNVSDKEVKVILKTIKNFLKLIEKSSGFIYENQITPFALKDEQETKTTETYNEAIDTLNPFEIISPFEQKIKTMQKMIMHQEEAIISQEKKIDLNTKKGETVYGNYQPLQKVLDFVESARKEGKEWKEIELELKKVKKIKSVNLRAKKIIIDL
jgi:predicted ribosome quality control (RQC) complex YloA/Tae2 family protein